jgi:hypothetical protein
LLTRRQELAQHPALTQPGFPPFVTAMFTYSLALLDSELNWLANFEKEFIQGDTQNGKN